MNRLKRLALFVSAVVIISVFGLVSPAFAAPVFTTTSPLPDATTGALYEYQFEANGTGAVEYFASGGLLGSGFSITTGGLLSGTPTTAATHTFQITAYDNEGQTTQTFELTVNDPTSFDFTSPEVLPDGYLNVPYSYTLQFAGGTLANVQLFEGSVLPPGLTLDSTTGVISGTPTYKGGYMFTLQALDIEGSPAVLRQFSMTIEDPPDPPVITTESLPDGQVGEYYEESLAATGTEPLFWRLEADSLPGGLSLSNYPARISGVPTTEGTFTFTLSVEDNFLVRAEKQFTITIAPEETEYTFVETIEVLNITATTATIKGEVHEFFGSTIQRGFIYGDSLPLDIDSPGQVAEILPIADAIGEFTMTLTGLSPGTTYNVCAFVSYEGTAYGRILQFTTLGAPDPDPDPEPEPDPDPNPEPQPGPDPDPEPEPEELPITGGGSVVPVGLSMMALGGYLWMNNRKKKA